MDLRQVRAFVAVVDAGTFTDAARELGLTQASVSRSVAGLEAALGVRLLQRSTRHVALTAVGTQVLATARRVLDEVAHLHRIAAQSLTELRIGYAWAALGKHTRRVQKAWAAAHPGLPLVFVQSNTPTAGLADGAADVAVVRKALDDPRFETALLGTERRYGVVATDNPLARKRSLRLADLTRYSLAVDDRTGTTTLDLWQPGTAPAVVRNTRSVDEWLTLIAAGQAVGMTSEATASLNPRPGVAYRAVVDAPPIAVWLAWWKDQPPQHLNDLITLACDAYRV
ncbi:DNA-binding transcriptional regulator, LysR family [Lentzea xinjiangensis]|uniref:DNA-binding transcriptional regulator, LysR family n=1 Tax=Lentzea xinjiangensis TaxID=402600 RepID=A0A1H9VW05_9PSEU|nr:LysR family transcriptional regulator [Lentzea xinjiangensis]SES25473.1 DNA-binding transcriptional regulator, LysR family [Lentzea xinjiangensis]